MERGAIVLLAAIAVAGTLATASTLSAEVLAMNGQQWIMIIVVLAAGYVAGRLFAQPARLVGLP